jgi:hypothetical protein
VTSPYVVQTWVDGAGGGTPVNAARLTHIEAGLSGHDTRLAALEYDTGWVNITFRTGFASMATGDTAQIRRVGRHVKLRGGAATTGIAAANTAYVVADVPAAIPIPAVSMGWGGGSSAGNAVYALLIGNDRTINIRTGGALGTYYRFDAANWWID